MKLPRWFLFGFGLAALLVAGLVTTALLPSVQKWAVLRAASRQPGIRLTLGSVSAGVSSFQASQVAFAQRGLVVKADEIAGDYSLWSLLVARRVQVDRLVVRGVAVDLSHLPAATPAATAPATAAAAPVAFAGVFAGLQLPVDVQLGQCEIDGRALLPGPPGRPPIQAEYNITGGQFGPGREASFLVNARLTNPQPRHVATLRVNATLRVAQSPQRTLQSVGLNAVIDAEGPALTEKNQLRIEARLAQTGGGETYTVKVDTLASGSAETVLEVRADFPAAGKVIAGAWSLKANRAQVEPFFLGDPLPEFGAYGYGRFQFETDTRHVALNGCHFTGVADNLGALAPSLEALGAISVQADFDFTHAEPMARFDRLDLVLAGQRPVLEIRARRALEIDLDKRTFHFDGGPGEVLRLKLLGVPATWLRPFVSALAIADGSLTGDVSFLAEGSNLRAQSTAPLKLTGLEFGGATPPLPGKTDVALMFDALATPEKIQATVRDFRLETATGDTITAQAEINVPAGAAPPVSLKIQFDADLPRLLAASVPVDRLWVKGDADVTLQDARLDVRTLTAAVAANGAPLLTASALQPFSFDFAHQRATPASAAAPDLLRVVLGRVPLQSFASAVKGLALEGEVTQGEFFLAADGDKLLFTSRQPLKFAGVSVAQAGQPMFKQIAGEASPSGEFGPAGTKIDTGPLVVRNGAGATLLSAQAEFVQLPGAETRLNLSFQLDVPALATQPLFTQAAVVTQGRAAGEVRALFGKDTVQVEARATVNGLVARDSGQPLPVANLSLRAVTTPDGAVSVQAPLLLDHGGQRSDLNFSADLKPAGAGRTFDARLTSGNLEVADIRALLGVFLPAAAGPPGPAAPAKAAPVKMAAAAPADLRPVWAGVSGQVTLEFKSVVYGKQWTMSGLTGLAQIEDTRVVLQKLAATFDEKSHLEARAELRFAAKAERPYQLDGTLAVTDFDAGRLFRAIEATKTPTIEGLFTVNGKVAGDGQTLGDLADRARGQFDLTSRKGIFRGLQRTTTRISTASKAVQFGAALGAFLGSDAVAKSAEKVAGSAYFVDELAASLGEFAYDQLSVTLTRDETLNLRLDNVSLISPEARFVGRGQLTYAKGVPLLEQALNLELALTSRGKIEQMVGKLGALDGTRDDLGYAKMKFPVTITGTLEKPDPAKFYGDFAASGLFNLLGR